MNYHYQYLVDSKVEKLTGPLNITEPVGRSIANYLKRIFPNRSFNKIIADISESNSRTSNAEISASCESKETMGFGSSLMLALVFNESTQGCKDFLRFEAEAVQMGFCVKSFPTCKDALVWLACLPASLRY